MRFLCVCVAVLSGLVAVRCIVFPPKPLEATILRGILANDTKWKTIITQELNPEELDHDGMLGNLDLTPAPGTGITPNKIIQRLVTHKSMTGTQLMFGIRVIGIALMNQFTKTLMAHLYLANIYAGRQASSAMAMRYSIYMIQLSLVNFADKVAFFSHPTDFFRELNDNINVFFNKNKDILNNEEKMDLSTRTIIQDFLSTLLNSTKERVKKASHTYKNLDNEEIYKIMKSLNFTFDVTDDINTINGQVLYGMINEIDIYEHVNVSSIGLNFTKKRFDIHHYEAEI